MMSYAIVRRGESRSFPEDDAFIDGAVPLDTADVVIHLGLPSMVDPAKAAVVIELGDECLGVHIDASRIDTWRNVLGFARYRNGSEAPSTLVELVRDRATSEAAVAAARAVFEGAGFAVSVCVDQPGRIIDRLVRPKYNAALRLVDEGLAEERDLDLTCRLGLGYPDGPVERVVRGGLARHYDVTTALFAAFGTSAYAPARRAIVAAMRRDRGL